MYSPLLEIANSQADLWSGRRASEAELVVALDYDQGNGRFLVYGEIRSNVSHILFFPAFSGTVWPRFAKAAFLRKIAS